MKSTVLILVCLAWFAQAGENDAGKKMMLGRRQELKLELLRQRSRIMREDTEAVSLRRRIEALQVELKKLVDGKPEVRSLQAQLKTVEEYLQKETGKKVEKKAAKKVGAKK